MASVKRIYGDWTAPQLGSWKKVLLEYSINPVQQFAYTKGKNATDSSLIIDAMDLLYRRGAKSSQSGHTHALPTRFVPFLTLLLVPAWNFTRTLTDTSISPHNIT